MIEVPQLLIFPEMKYLKILQMLFKYPVKKLPYESSFFITAIVTLVSFVLSTSSLDSSFAI